MQHSTNENEQVPLTQREIEVIELVADGLSNQEIADTMVIAVHTVKVHLKHIFTKLEVTKRTQAVARARQLGFLGDELPGTVQPAQPSYNLPRSLIPLIGRENELSILTRYLTDADQRLITIHGPGGVGKTHLAIEVAWQHLSTFRDGVFVVSLEPLDSSLFLLSAIAEALGFQFSGQGKRKDQLLAYLNNKQMLLVMDGFEHLLDNTTLIGDLLAASPELKIVVTSRERLNIHGEVLYRLQGVTYQPEKTKTSDAVTLFCYCAERALPEFQPDTNDLAQIATICQSVEGLPLGILLAASWINAISIQDILTEIQQQAYMLETETLSTLFQYKGFGYVFQRSWDQLAPHQRDVFMRLAVFRGNFTRDAAAHVAGASPRILSILVNKAMIEWDPLHKHYRIHRLFRQFGQFQLQTTGIEDSVKEIHFNFFLAFTQTGQEQLKHDPAVQQAWEYAIADLRAALQWAYDTNHIDHMLELCLAMTHYWGRHGYFQEYFDWLTLALDAIGDPSSVLHARALRAAGEMAKHIGKPTMSRSYIQRSISLWHQFEEPDEICRALMVLGDNEHVAGHYAEATKNYEDVLEIARGTHNKTFLMMGLHGLGLVADVQQQHQQAMTYYRESIDYARQLDNQRFIGVMLCNMGVIAIHQGDYDNAARLYAEALEIARRENDLALVVTNLVNLAEVAYKQQDCFQARKLSIESLELAHEIGFKMAIVCQLELIAQIENAEGSPVKSARLYGAAKALREAIDFAVPPREQQEHTTSVDTIREQLRAHDFEAAWGEGYTTKLETIITELTRH